MNLSAVTPTFQSAGLAGWKTGVTKVSRFKVLIRVQCWRFFLPARASPGRSGAVNPAR